VNLAFLGPACKLQPTVSLSSTEAEYRVLTNVAKDIIYFLTILSELGLNIDAPTSLLSNNQSCIKLVQNPVMHSRTKHIGIQHHFIREKAKDGTLQVHHIPTSVQQADFLTKPLTYNSFVSNRERVGLIPLQTASQALLSPNKV